LRGFNPFVLDENVRWANDAFIAGEVALNLGAETQPSPLRLSFSVMVEREDSWPFPSSGLIIVSDMESEKARPGSGRHRFKFELRARNFLRGFNLSIADENVTVANDESFADHRRSDPPQSSYVNSIMTQTPLFFFHGGLGGS
jgi:hypothetical protein